MNIFMALLYGKRKENLREASLENMGLTSNWECVKGNGRSSSVLEKDTWG